MLSMNGEPIASDASIARPIEQSVRVKYVEPFGSVPVLTSCRESLIPHTAREKIIQLDTIAAGKAIASKFMLQNRFPQ